MDRKRPVGVMYLDDEPDLLDLEKTCLEQGGEMQIDITTSPHEALDRAASRQYDAIMTDYLMPEMDGIAVLKQVRAINATIPVIFLSGKSTRSAVIDAINHRDSNSRDRDSRKGARFEILVPSGQFQEPYQAPSIEEHERR